MKTKNIYLFVAIIFTLVSVSWNYHFADAVKNFYSISEWGIYLLVVPIAYYFIAFFTKKSIDAKKVMIFITIGVIIQILLNRDLANSFFWQKVFATIIGNGMIWVINKVLP
ncbi:hypothetical protein FACS189426_18400 [Bacteroidia bacterium]|nr:hypothetical protein FACS189426_18400 [Bacteroidia bacterium]